MDTRTSPIRLRMDQLRDAMQRTASTRCSCPSSDPHLSEYLPRRWQGREWLSGFTGSVGTLIATAELAGCWPTAATGPRPRPNWPAPASR